MFQPDYKAIGRKIKKYRQSNGLSHLEFAEKSKIGSKRTVARYENGVRDMKISSLYKIAWGLGVRPKDLL